MSFIMVDIEADGPIPGDYSMISFGAVTLGVPHQTFYGKLAPISKVWMPDALKVSGFTREETEKFPKAGYTMLEFRDWVEAKGGPRPMFISDNNGFDWQFINWYFHHFLGTNPFGFSSTNLGSLYKGLVKNTRENFKHLRKTKHTHNPVDDAMGNVEALIHMRDKMGLKI